MKLVWKKILSDPALWLLLLVNCYIVYKYEYTPQIFTTLIWLYYSQNILLGFFNFLDMATVRNIDVTDIKVNLNTTKDDRSLSRSYTGGFLLMFGFFHFVYFIFLITMKKSGPFDWDFYKNFLLVFFVFQLISFVQHKIFYKNHIAKISRMATMPFLRIIPMHLCILIPAFLNISNLTIFLVLKVITDIISYISTTSYYKNNELDIKARGIDISRTDF